MKSEFQITVQGTDFRPVTVEFKIETKPSFDSRCGVCMASFQHVVATARGFNGKQIRILGSSTTPGNFIWVPERLASRRTADQLVAMLVDTCKAQIEYGHVQRVFASSKDSFCDRTFGKKKR